MSDTFNYSLLKNENGNYVLRSTITSFGLNQVTDKDIVSFYKQFSGMSSFDTGLLPVDGTGVLSIRSAGNHMQVAVQHKPGCYHVNWGSHEGDRNAETYYLAQPYRVVVGDFKNGTLLGARMFYSPTPITHPNQPLYHVNLPNINCLGYRGNGVGWICLYLKEDWSSISFNEKVSRLIERCSGVETYNDANMSETDGPRFYQRTYQEQKPENYFEYNFLWNPKKWQAASIDQNGSDNYYWTLNSDLWIQILVKDMDHQACHDPAGVPLTFAMALLGNYQAYYTDKDIPKLYNLVARNDLVLTNKEIADMIKSSFALAPVAQEHSSKDNPFQFTVDQRQKKAETIVQPKLFNEDDDDNETWSCDHCGEEFDSSESAVFDYLDQSVCTNCISNDYVYLETPSTYYPTDSEYVFYAQNIESYLHSEQDNCITCSNCDYAWGAYGDNPVPVYELQFAFDANDNDSNNSSHFCENCISSVAKSFGYEEDLQKCSSCNENHVINNVAMSHLFKSKAYIDPKIDETEVKYSIVHKLYCATCSSTAWQTYTCPCGLLNDTVNGNGISMSNCKLTVMTSGPKNEFVAEVSAACYGCLGNIQQSEDGSLQAEFVPFNKEIFDYTHTYFTQEQKDTMLGVKSYLDLNKVIF